MAHTWFLPWATCLTVHGQPWRAHICHYDKLAGLPKIIKTTRSSQCFSACLLQIKQKALGTSGPKLTGKPSEWAPQSSIVVSPMASIVMSPKGESSVASSFFTALFSLQCFCPTQSIWSSNKPKCCYFYLHHFEIRLPKLKSSRQLVLIQSQQAPLAGETPWLFPFSTQCFLVLKM